MGPQSALACENIYLNEVNWLLPSIMNVQRQESVGKDVFVKLRNTAPASPAKLFLDDNRKAHIVLQKPEYGIATGQAVVVYDGNDPTLMLGGGWIISAPISAS